jgi:nicotinamide phosphoribosyltransferase
MKTLTLPVLLTDGYKLDHRRQYPEGTTKVYSNLTPRTSRIDGMNGVISFGLQYYIKEYLIRQFNENFFKQDIDKIEKIYTKRVSHYLGSFDSGFEHIRALHKLGYLPIEIKALQEGVYVPIGIPLLTITNTRPDFFWLTNLLETQLSCVVWQATTSATIAFMYGMVLGHFGKAPKPNYPKDNFEAFQCHDFSFRGMSSVETAMLSSAGHATSFVGSDTLPVVDFLEEFYNSDTDEELVITTVPATEHSVMCMGAPKGEFELFKRLITEVYPSGIVSIVSDTWDLWKVLTDYLPRLKKEILARDGKVVIRPDSGDPVLIICGDPKAEKDSNEFKGVATLLKEAIGDWEKIGMIYGDSITPERCFKILNGLKAKKIPRTSIVFGVGSYTYQYNTRDTFGFAMKATYGEVNGKGVNIFKKPITDKEGAKTSAKGLLKVQMRSRWDDNVAQKDWGKYKLIQEVSAQQERGGDLFSVFKNGELIHDDSLRAIRERVWLNHNKLDGYAPSSLSNDYISALQKKITENNYISALQKKIADSV